MNLIPLTTCKHRVGFTLLELLMVIAVLSILMALSFSVLRGITEQAETEATKVTVAKINRLLEQRVEAFDRAFQGAGRNKYVVATLGLLSSDADARFDYFLAHPDEVPPEIMALARKAAFRFEFPQRMAELTVLGGDLNSDGIPDIVYDQLLVPSATQQLVNEGSVVDGTTIAARVTANWAKHLAHENAVLLATGGVSSTGSVDGIHSTESSELLYFFLTQSKTFGASPGDADSFTVTELRDTDGDGMLEFVDAWMQPFRFYRWPTRLVDPDAPTPFQPVFSTVDDPTEVDLTPQDVTDGNLRRVTGFERELAEVLLKGLPPTPTPIGTSTPRDILLIDPDDPVGLLYTFLENPKYIALNIDVSAEFNEAKYHTPDTYHAPLIVSAGPDGLLGLREPNDVTPPDGVFGNLAQYAGTFVGTASPRINPNSVSGVVDSLFDNISNRNRRAGGRR